MSARTIHPFPARMAPEIALAAIPERDDEALTVIDPMCGSGTVLSVALQRGHNAIGVDIDPLAVMMSQLTVSPVDTDELMRGCRQAIATAEETEGTPPWGDDPETDAFVSYWFGESQRANLLALSSALEETQSNVVQLALRLAISRIIVTKSPQASLAADTAHSRPHKVLQTSSYDVIEGFKRSAEQLARLLERRNHKGTGLVSLGDARALESVANASADMAVTSPPYLNALDYLRGHKLALVWFGHTIADLRKRRSISIGAERRADSESSEAVQETVQTIESEAGNIARIRKGMLDRFTQDCYDFAAELNRTIKPHGSAVLVVGNSFLRGNYIRNDWITEKAMEHAGFTLVDRYERDIPPNSRYMAIGSSDDTSAITKRMRKEVVLTMTRAGQ